MIKRWAFPSLVLVLCVVAATGTVYPQANEPREAYAFNTLGLGAGADSFADEFGGNDLLPYTSDDSPVPVRGNIGGTWGFAHFDSDSDKAVDANEHIFTVTRRDDDDAFTYSVMSHPEHGVIYEAEDWVDYHDANNLGPSATLAPDLGAEGNDFEHQDRPFFEGQSNAYLYNNLRANQHGKGKARYYFENINAGSPAAAGEPWIYNEIEGYTKFLNFQNNLDDPVTALNERGTCRNAWMRSPNAVIRGYLIPVDDLPTLANGSLPSLFGWEAPGFDLAAYLRDTIAPKIEDADVLIYHPVLGSDPTVNLPITHLMLQQIEVAMEVNIGGSCADPAIAQMLADYWGIPATGGTYRASNLLGHNLDHTAAIFGENVRPWSDIPADGSLRNLWLLDHYFRDDVSIIGRYTVSGGPWSIQPDPGFAVIDDTSNKVLQSEAGGLVRAPLPRALATDASAQSELPLELVVDIAAEPGSTFQLILFAGADVAAYAEVSESATGVFRGGMIGGSGLATGGVGNSMGFAPVPGDPVAGVYTRYVLQVTRSRISLLEAPMGDYAANDFSGLNPDDIAELVRTPISGSGGLPGISEVGVAVSDIGLVSTIAVLAAPPGSVPPEGGMQRPVDCNQDGNIDISDGICLLGFLFQGNPTTLPCGDGSSADPANRALVSTDSSPVIELTDAIRLFTFLFLGGPSPTNCVDPMCEVCIEIVGCPTVCN